MHRTWNPPTPTENFFDTFALLAWESAGAAFEEFYKDDDARAMLGGLTTSALLKTDRWLTHLATTALANLRITGINGFGPSSATFSDVHAAGWRSYFNSDYSGDKGNYSPHYQVAEAKEERRRRRKQIKKGTGKRVA